MNNLIVRRWWNCQKLIVIRKKSKQIPDNDLQKPKKTTQTKKEKSSHWTWRLVQARSKGGQIIMFKKFKKFIPKKCFVILYFLVVLFSLVIINNSLKQRMRRNNRMSQKMFNFIITLSSVATFPFHIHFCVLLCNFVTLSTKTLVISVVKQTCVKQTPSDPKIIGFDSCGC